MKQAESWPTEIRLSKDGRSLAIGFEDGYSVEIPAELLRVRSPSAEVQGHNPSERRTIPGKRDVAIIQIEPVGNYAVRLGFDDLHDTGIFSWGTLRDFGENQAAMMAEYEAELAAKNMKRAPSLPPGRG